MSQSPTDDYRAAGFNRRLGPGEHIAVLIVDMCRAYFTEGSPLNLADRGPVDACNELVSAARAAQVPVLWSRVEFGADPLEAPGRVFYRKVGALSSFDAGNPLGDWLDGLEPIEDEVVVTKTGASAFFGTSLIDELRRLDIDTLLIGGVSTSGCVRATAIDACQHDIVAIVVDDACGDRTEDIHRSNLFDLDAKYADVEPLGRALEILSEAV